MSFELSAIIFIFGLCIGSFLNVVILRLEKSETLGGRSYCPHCKHQLMWLDLIPVFSFIFLGGKCRYCGAKISWQYPAVETATALLFLGIFNLKFEIFNQFEMFQFLNLVLLWYIAGSLIVIFVYDLKHFIIPDKVLFPAIVATFLFQISNFKFQISPLLLNYLLAAILASTFFLCIFLISRGAGMGFGDVKFAILMGLLLGWPNILVALVLAFWLGAIIGLVLMFLSKKGLKSQIPFAPFLIAGTFLALFFGSQIIHWYVKLLLI